MHANDKQAPKPGSLMYSVDETLTGGASLPLCEFVVVLDGSTVWVVLTHNLAVKQPYDPGRFSPTLTEAKARAAARARARASELTALAEKMEAPANA